MARIVTFPKPKPDDGPEVPSIVSDSWHLESQPDIKDPIVATERMWWRETGRLAYPLGATFPSADLPLLVGNEEHEANMRAGIADCDAAVARHPAGAPAREPLLPVETRLITSAPEVRGEERHRGGRPRLPRDKDGTVIRP